MSYVQDEVQLSEEVDQSAALMSAALRSAALRSHAHALMRWS